MTDFTLRQLVDLAQLRRLFRAHHRLSGIASILLDPNGNLLISSGGAADKTPPSELQSAANLGSPRNFDDPASIDLPALELPIRLEGRTLATLRGGPVNPRIPNRHQVRANLQFLHDMIQTLVTPGCSASGPRCELERQGPTESAHQEPASILQAIIDNSDALIFSLDRDFCYTSFNRGHAKVMEALYGARIKPGQNLLEAMTVAQDRATAERNLQRALDGETLVEMAYSGEETRERNYFQVTHSPLRNERGTVVGVAVMAQDLTPLKRAEERLQAANAQLEQRVAERKTMETALRAGEQVFRILVENSPDIIARYNLNCRRTYVNPMYLKVAQLPRHQLLASAPEQCSPLPAAEAKAISALLRRVLDAGAPETLDIYWPKTNGPDSWYNISAFPEFDAAGKVVSVMTISRDFSDRKRIEDSLAAKRQQLATMTQELSLAEERERLRIAAVLHDHIGQILLLGGIKLGALNGVKVPPRVRTALDEIRALLDQAARDTHSLTVQLNPPVLAVAGLAAALEWLARQMESDFGLRVEFCDDRQPKPLGSERDSIIYQCARELLINVAKHAATDRAQLVTRREEDNYLLMVEDCGRGFDPAILGAVDAETWRCGLFSIQIKIERLGGSIRIKAAAGQGSRIEIRLPLRPNIVE
jgi:PAS domain S-box-containing protein